jgi:hypothetical protein
VVLGVFSGPVPRFRVGAIRIWPWWSLTAGLFKGAQAQPCKVRYAGVTGLSQRFSLHVVFIVPPRTDRSHFSISVNASCSARDLASRGWEPEWLRAKIETRDSFWNVALHRMLSLSDRCGGQTNVRGSSQMSKPKPKTSRHARSPKIAAKTQTQAVVRSPKHERKHSIAADLSEPPFERLEDGSKQDALLADNPVTALQDDGRHTMTHNLNKGFEFSSATATLRAYQAKLLEMSQADMQFVFEFTQRLATIRSPAEFPSVIAEFTSRRISMFRKYSKEMFELSTKR